ncbi:chromate transporter [Pseudoduganella sp. RAF53_2]|uniref:chromate transporter n=1 Tax=unclassified Pseudoduganella TaxID=2637179 RepID=UPI003F9EB0CD
MNINCRALFKLFSQMALLGFGGVLPFAYRYLVERARWLTAEEFGALLGVAQLLPGPTICNLAVIVGQRFAGTRGAMAALAGLLVAPFFIVIALGVAYQQLATSALFANALHGMAAVAAGLILATAAKLAHGMWKQGAARSAAPETVGAPGTPGSSAAANDETHIARQIAQFVLLAMAFFGLGVMKLSLVTVVCALAPFGFVMFAFVWRLP